MRKALLRSGKQYINKELSGFTTHRELAREFDCLCHANTIRHNLLKTGKTVLLTDDNKTIYDNTAVWRY